MKLRGVGSLLTVALVFGTSSLALAGGEGISLPAPPEQSQSIWEVPPTLFHRVQVGRYGYDLRFRDLEFWWDSLYSASRGELGASDSVVKTLDRLGRNIADQPGFNPYGVEESDIQLVYDYMQRTPGPAYSTNPLATYGFQTGPLGDNWVITSSGADVQPVPDVDRGHVDMYVYTGHDPVHGYQNYGMWPSQFWTQKEDSSTGHWFSRASQPDSFVVFHGNSIMMPGPALAGSYFGPLIDVNGVGWTKRDMGANWGFCHEFQHSLNLQSPSAMMDEMFSAAAEAVAGNADKRVDFECPYSWNLFQHTSNQMNYQGRRAFTEYLAWNFRGADTSPTASGLTDDLLYKWAKSNRSLGAFDSLLASSECYDCNRYFGDVTDPRMRQALLLHDWRVANFVNDTTLAQGQYGYPPVSDFSPAVDVGAWKSFDGSVCDDSVSVPPELTASRRWAWQDTTAVGLRPGATPACPKTSVRLPVFGAQYWVIRSDTSLAHGTQDLVVRVSLEGINNWQDWFEGPLFDATLLASAVPYSQQCLESGEPDSLWKHPEWAGEPLAPKWVDVDSAAAALEIVVPNFGTDNKAALIVITAADGPAAGFAQEMSNAIGLNSRAKPYRLSMGIREAGVDTISSRLVTRTADANDDCAAWSPIGGSLVYQSTITSQSSLQQIYEVATTGGTPSRVYPQALIQASPDWSPRGDWIAFDAESTAALSSIWIHSVTTGQSRRVTPQDRLHRSPVFQPNGQRLAYAASPLIVGGQIYDGWEIRRVNIDGTGDVALTPLMCDTRPTSIRWSPDGNRVFFTRNDSVFVVNAAGGTPAYCNSLVRKASSLDFHPADWRMAIEEPGSYNAIRQNEDTQYFVPIAFRRMALRDSATNDNEARFYRTSAEFFNPRWSPDGVSIAYSADLNAAGDRDLYIGRVSFNHPPRFVPEPSDANLVAGTPYTTALLATDPDGQPVTFSAFYLPPGATFSGNTFSWPNPTLGAYYVVFRATDGTGGVHSKVICLNVTESPGGGCPFVDVKTDKGWSTENSILARATDRIPRLDGYRLKATPSMDANRVTVRLRENEQEFTSLDQVRLAVIDHAPELNVVADGEQVWLGSRVPAARVVDNHGRDVTASVAGGTDAFTGWPGDTLWVSMWSSKPRDAASALRTMDGGPGEIDDGDKGGGGGVAFGAKPADAEGALDASILTNTGILIQVPDGAGGWRTIEHRYPRESFDEHVIDSLAAGDMRLIFLGRHRVRFIGRLAEAQHVSPVVLTPRSAVHSRLGDQLGTVGSTAGTTTALTPGDTLVVVFDVPPPSPGKVRDWMLITNGVYSSSPFSAEPAIRPEMLPTRFALGQSQPNPSSGATTIRFELPVASPLSLELFDLQGRRVATLAQGMWAAGYHAVSWNRSRDDGGVAQPGVYFYRMIAGTFVEHRKLVLTN